MIRLPIHPAPSEWSTRTCPPSTSPTPHFRPAWAGQERDGVSPSIRSDDMFFGAKPGDVQPDWVDLNKVAIPQADEEQRLLAAVVDPVLRPSPRGGRGSR